MKYFVTAIGTDSGKTLTSAILCRATGYDYWKPVQAGIEEADSDTIRSYFGPSVHIHPEAYRLTQPMSPHAAARIDNVEVDLDQIVCPKEDNLIIEGAGGLMVPLNDREHIIDLIERIDCEVILVCDLYLGSINHSLLSINELKRRNIKVAGIIFNGDANEESQKHILDYSGYKEILHIKREKNIDGALIQSYADLIQL